MESIEPRLCSGRITSKKAALIIACIGLIIELTIAVGGLLLGAFIAQYYRMLICLFIASVAAINIPFEAALIYGIVKGKWRPIHTWRLKAIGMIICLMLLELPIYFCIIKENAVINLFVILAVVFFLGFQLYIVQPYYKYLHTQPVISSTQVPMVSEYNVINHE